MAPLVKGLFSIHNVLGSIHINTTQNRMVVHACSLSTQEVEAEGSEVQGHSLLHREFKASLRRRGRFKMGPRKKTMHRQPC